MHRRGAEESPYMTGDVKKAFGRFKGKGKDKDIEADGGDGDPDEDPKVHKTKALTRL